MQKVYRDEILVYGIPRCCSAKSGTSACDPFIGDKTVTDFVEKKTGNFCNFCKKLQELKKIPKCYAYHCKLEYLQNQELSNLPCYCAENTDHRSKAGV